MTQKLGQASTLQIVTKTTMSTNYLQYCENDNINYELINGEFVGDFEDVKKQPLLTGFPRDASVGLGPGSRHGSGGISSPSSSSSTKSSSIRT